MSAHPTNASAAESVNDSHSPAVRSTGAEPSTSELPPNPDLISPVPQVADGVTDAEARQALNTEVPTRVRLGLHGGVSSRQSTSESAEYAPGFGWGGYASVVLLPWLSLRVASLIARYDVSPNEGAWGLSDVSAAPPPMRELALRAEVELRRSVAPRLSVWGVAGLGWARVSMGTFTLKEPYPVSVEMRSGSLVEIPLGVGVGYELWDEHLVLTLDFRLVPSLSQTGDLFSPQAGQGDAVRSDTGSRITLDGLPELRAATTALLGVEVSF